MRFAKPTVLLSFLLLLAPTLLAGQPAQLVADLNTTRAWGPDSFPWRATFVTAGGFVYFPMDDGRHGVELWRTDGTAAGTALVRDVCPGVCGSRPFWMTVVSGWIFFTADDGAHGQELWKSDGTAAGTNLVADLFPGLESGGAYNLEELNGRLVFTTHRRVTPGGGEVWTSDGSVAGTHLLAEIEPGPEPSEPAFLGQAGSFLLFSAGSSALGRELWKTDGTAAGTTFVADLNPGPGGSLQRTEVPYPRARYAVASGGKVYFAAYDGVHGEELWVSDGTAAGTSMLGDLHAGSGSFEGSYPYSLVPFGPGVLFRADDGVHGSEIWASDGTPAGTHLVADVNPGSGGSGPWGLTVAGSKVYFSALAPGLGRELWVTDGTAAGTTLVADVNPGEESGTPFSLPPQGVVGSTFLFVADDGVHGAELWKTDGTPAGTALLADINAGLAPSFYMSGGSDGEISLTAGGRFYFRAITDAGGFEVWTSDGTAAGTAQLKEIDDQTSSFFPLFLGVLYDPHFAADLSGTLLFSADDGSGRFELRKSDGTAAGTVKVSDGTPGTAAYLPQGFTRLGSALLFNADGGTNKTKLWRSDGTSAGTSVLKDLDPVVPYYGYPAWFSALGSKVVFAGPIGALWVSDGTTAGTQPVGADVGHVGPRIVLGSTLLFTGETGPHGPELWRTDGTAAGTSEVLDLRPGIDGGAPSRYTLAGGKVFFSATTDGEGTELWRTDGTAAGTALVKDIRPGAGDGVATGSVYDNFEFGESWAALGGKVVFAADDGVTGFEPWVSDGTAAGTLPLADLFPGARGAEPRWITPAGGRVVFVADDGSHGRELWTTDGTPAGTGLLKDIEPGPESALPMELRRFGNLILFSAWDAAHGRELWVSDGTAAGTKRVQDIAPGAFCSSPLGMTASGSRIYFVANDNTAGFELWSLPKSALGAALAATKTVSGFFYEGGTVTYQITVTNHGLTAQPDAPGAELTDILPVGLALTGATASSGAATVNAGTRTVTWNGAIASGATVTVTITATIQAGTLGATLTNQAQLAWDADGDGANEAAGVSDDPLPGGAADPTPVLVGPEKLGFYTLAPCRAADTRATTPLASGVKRTFPIAGAAGNCNIPATARAIAANLTLVDATGAGTLVAWKAGAPTPGTSNVNFKVGAVRGNNALIAVGAGGAIDAQATLPGGGTVQLVIDVSGYFQ